VSPDLIAHLLVINERYQTLMECTNFLLTTELC
jgi:hypothetical protein